MKNTCLKFVIAVWMIALMFPVAASAGDDAVVTKIDTASRLLLDKKTGPGEKCLDGVTLLVEAMVDSLPAADLPEKANAALKNALKEIKVKSPLAPSAGELLHQAYTVIHNGIGFQMPDIEEIQEAVDIGKKLLTAAKQNLKNGDTAQAVKAMLKTTLMVITPVRH